MKIIHNPQKCIGCGTCEAICPDFWQIEDDSKAHLQGGQSRGDQEELELTDPKCAQEAADSCPVQAIEIQPR